MRERIEVTETGIIASSTCSTKGKHLIAGLIEFSLHGPAISRPHANRPQHNIPYRLLIILLAMVAFMLARPHPAFAASNAELTEDDIFYQKSYMLLSTKRYEELDQFFKQSLDAYAGNNITAEDLSQKFETFSQTPGLEPRFDEWIKAFPTSYSARLARGIYRTTTAWEKRGSSLSGGTTDSQFRGFGEMLVEANTDLVASLALHPRPIARQPF